MGHILLTARLQATGKIQRLEIPPMGLEEGPLFLLRRAKRIGPNAPLDMAFADDQSAAKEIATNKLDGHPLALDQAGAYIEGTACGLSDYLRIWQTHGAKLLIRRGGERQDHPDPLRPHSIFRNSKKPALPQLTSCASLLSFTPTPSPKRS